MDTDKPNKISFETLETSSFALTWVILILIFGAIVFSMRNFFTQTMPIQIILLCLCGVVVMITYISIFKKQYSFQKISFADNSITLLGAGRPSGGNIILLDDIKKWNHKTLQFGKGYVYIIFFHMKNGSTFDVKCSAKNSPQIIREIEKRMSYKLSKID